jgi:D-3-phosphoglycerate dehydrogenase/C-terminal binding protein
MRKFIRQNTNQQDALLSEENTLGNKLVIIIDALTENRDIEESILDGIAEVVSMNAKKETDLIGHVENVDAIILFHTFRLSQSTIKLMKNCKVIVRAGVGYDNVEYKAARHLNIPVCNVPDYGTEDVADSAIGHMLSLTRGLHETEARLRKRHRDWTHLSAPTLYRLRGRTFGIIGLGRIGTATALRAKSLGLDVLYYDPYKALGADKSLGIRRVGSLQNLLEESSIVSLHCPLSEETRGMIGCETISMMQSGSFLINTARGHLVETKQVLQAIESGKLAGLALDVLPQEPPRKDDPLIKAWRDPEHPAHYRVILTPHIAFYSEEGLQDMRRSSAQICQLALLGQPLPNIVN